MAQDNRFDPERLERIERRLRVLEDREAIRNLKARYAALCDNQYDADGIASLFTEDAVWESPALGCFEGREAIRKLWAQLFETKFKEDTAKNSVEKIRFLKPDVAVVIVRIIHKRPAEETESLATFVMTKDGDKWVSKSTAVLQDGRKMTMTNVLTRVDADTITWQSKDRTLDEKAIPDMKPVKMKRVK